MPRRLRSDSRAEDISSLWARAGYSNRPANFSVYDPEAAALHPADAFPVLLADPKTAAEAKRQLWLQVK